MACILAMPGINRLRCARCGLPANAGTDQQACPCSSASPAFDQTMAVADYAAPLDRLVTSLKFGRELNLARPLGELLATRWLGSTPSIRLDCLVPVPLSASRLAQRGFNQALEMARSMAASVRAPLPVMPFGLRRLRDTPPQTGLSLVERRLNLAGAFSSGARFDGLHVGLVDDVMTSGSTLTESARLLKAAGACSVVALVVARTMRDSPA
jgi:ComF family protein